MSHITLIETNVKFMNENILRQALQALGEVGNGIVDHYNTRQKMDMSVYTMGVPKGIGFKKQGNGEYKVMMDDYGYVTQAHNLLNQISQKYQELAITKAVQHQGYHAQAQAQEDGTVKILARRY